MLSNDERDALKLTSDSTEANGLFIYNTDIDCVEFWSGSNWIDLCASALPSANINPATLATLTPGSGTLKGRTNFDIGVTEGGASGCGTVADRAADKADFGAVSAYNYTFTASATGTVRNVRYVIQDSEGVLQSSQSLSGTLVVGTLANNTSTQLTLNFKPDLNLPSSQPLIVGRDRISAAHVIINVIYNNGLTDLKVVETLNIQDCSCGNSVKTVGGGWLTFMCYNLGAADTVKFMSPAQQAAYTNPADEYGDLYQWGRKADGHQLRTAQAYPTNNTAYENGIVSGSNLDGNGQVASTSAAYGKFIKGFDNNAIDWRSPQVDTLWYNNGKKTVNDPCPTGWRVITEAEWQSILNGDPTQFSVSGGSYNSVSGNRWQWVFSSTPGYLVTPSGSSSPTLFLPAAGIRNGGSSEFQNINSLGQYWSSSTGGIFAYLLTFNSVGNVYPRDNSFRASGYSVRCVVE